MHEHECVVLKCHILYQLAVKGWGKYMYMHNILCIYNIYYVIMCMYMCTMGMCVHVLLEGECCLQHTVRATY